MPSKRTHAAAGAIVSLVVSGPAAGLTPPAAAAVGARSSGDAAVPPARDAAAIADLLALPVGPGSLSVRPGAWAEYVVRSRRSNGRVRFSVVAAEPDAVTLEAAMFGDAGVPFTVRLRFRTALGRGDRRCLTRLDSVVVSLLGFAPIELPVATPRFRERCGTPAFDAQAVKLTVPAGTFAAEESDGPRGERVWQARDVPLWGIVRSQGHGRRAELVAFGWSGARSFLAPQGMGSDNTNE